ncbi:hydantoinase/oxoprolinase family protein [Pigmentiphaga soli]|uniref:Hydantoinase/oxoprolinase family protein n=1 Tax=Pigmentiphaga soli TaxID=1007095 RepID=A0ABP8GTD2_9BURK
MYRIGVDVGGTFTDFTLLDERSLKISYHKVPSTPSDPSTAIRQGIGDLLERFGIAPADVGFIGHGTTVATNLIIERRGVKCGLLTTRGFRDLLEIGRQTRPSLYDYRVTKPEPIVERSMRLPVTERIDADGRVLAELDRDDLERGVSALKAAGVEAVAICFLHSYRNDEHEAAAREAVARQMPGCFVSVSSEILPEFREYERLSTTALNSYAGPTMQRYLDRLARGIGELGMARQPYTVHSNGGLMSMETVRRFPVRTCLSGPSAGVVGAAAVSAAGGYRNLITFDVGGTSTDVSLIKDGTPAFTSSRLVADHPIRTPMVDVQVIGAGGGSIAWIDDAGALKVGPHSAGADPGPIAYDRGGERVAVTDVNICLQRLNPVALLDGQLPVNAAKARAALAAQIAAPLGLDPETAAYGVLRVVNANMSRAIRSVSTERGYDLADFALFAYGGAGPLHACEVAAECGIPLVIVPQEPGTMCARGILLTDLTMDFVRTRIAPANAAIWPGIVESFASMKREGEDWLEREKVLAPNRSFRMSIDARYVGQNHEISVPVDDMAGGGLDAFLHAFRAVHVREYGYDIPGRAVEIVNCRLQAIGKVPRAPLSQVEAGSREAARSGRRDVYFGASHGWVQTDIYARERLPVDEPIEGPAIVDEMSSTTVIPPGDVFRVDAIGNLVIEVNHVN